MSSALTLLLQFILDENYISSMIIFKCYFAIHLKYIWNQIFRRCVEGAVPLGQENSEEDKLLCGVCRQTKFGRKVTLELPLNEYNQSRPVKRSGKADLLWARYLTMTCRTTHGFVYNIAEEPDGFQLYPKPSY